MGRQAGCSAWGSVFDIFFRSIFMEVYRVSQFDVERPSHRRPVGMQVTIQSPAGAYVSLRVTPTTTISELRELVRTKTGLSTKIRAQLESCAVIVFRKHVIDPSKTLQEAGVSNGSTLQALQYW